MLTDSLKEDIDDCEQAYSEIYIRELLTEDKINQTLDDDYFEQNKHKGVTFFEPIGKKIEPIKTPSSDSIPRAQYQVVFSKLNQIMHKIDVRSRDQQSLYILQNIRDDFDRILDEYDHIISKYDGLKGLVDRIRRGIDDPNAMAEFNDTCDILKTIQIKIAQMLKLQNPITNEFYDKCKNIISANSDIIKRYPTLQKLAEQIYTDLDACQREDKSENEPEIHEIDEEYMTVSKKIHRIKNQIDQAGDNCSVDALNNIYNEFDDIMLLHSDIIAKNPYLAKLIDEIMNSIWQ